jgi:hypothetical protein
MKSLYVNWSRARQIEARTLEGYLGLVLKKLNLLWGFFPLLGGICLLPSVALLRRGNVWTRLAFAAVVAIVIIELQLVHSYTYPHYLAPMAGLFYVVLFQGVRWWRIAGRRHTAGRWVLPSIVTYSLLSLLAYCIWQFAGNEPSARAVIEARLSDMPGRHLVFVDYPRRHNLHQEWVYNRADIDSSQIVWANRLTEKENGQLVDYYGETRHAWVWHVGQQPPSLEPWAPISQIAKSR